MKLNTAIQIPDLLEFHRKTVRFSHGGRCREAGNEAGTLDLYKDARTVKSRICACAR